MGKHLPFSCTDVEICAAAILDGQLSPAEEQLVEEHLMHCSACCDLIDALGEQRLEPPRIQIIQQQDYWDEMDAVLQEELERAEEDTPMTFSWSQLALYAAVLLLTLAWGWQQRQRAQQLERIVYTQQQTLEHLERVTIQDSSNATQTVVYTPTKLER